MSMAEGALARTEQDQLQQHEAVIERGLGTFVEVGTALAAIRDARLYRAEHATFEDYCRERWGFSKSHANRLVESAEVVLALTPIGVTDMPVIANEGQARAIAPVLKEHGPEVAVQVLREAATDTLTAASIVKVANEIRRDKREAKRVEVVKQREAHVKAGTNVDIRLGDFREVLAGLSDVDAIITDPPYPKEYLPLLDDLAAWADRALKPDGILAVMMGQSYLPDVYRRLSGYRPYLWTLAYLTPGGQAVQVWDRKVNTFWKPILVYGAAPDWFGDVAKSDTNDNDKNHHHWGQSVSGMSDLVRRLTKPGSHIVDPFLGAGTTALAAMANGCHFTGCDIDEAFVQTSIERCGEWAA